VGEAVERELARVRGARAHTYSHIERAENILGADLVCKGTGDA